MRDQQQRPVEVGERGCQCVAGGRIQMVRRFVQDQQLRPLVQHQREQQARLLAAGHRPGRAGGVFTGKPEAAQFVAQLLITSIRRQPPKVFERRARAIETVDPLLGEVTGAHRRGHVNAAGQCCQVTGQGADQRRLAGAVASEHTDARTAPDRQVDIAQDHVVGAVAGRQRLRAQHRIGTAIGFVQGEIDFVRPARRQYPYHAFERLDPALHLTRLRCLGAEALDEGFELSDPLALAVALALELHPALCLLLLEGTVAAGIADQFRLFEMQDGLGDAIDEIAVMRDECQRARIARQPAFEPEDRIEIEVIGRLVEQQQITGCKERARQIQPHPPAAREGVDRRLRALRIEAESSQQRMRARFGRGAAGVDPAFVGRGDRHPVAVRCCLQLRLCTHQFRIAVEQVAPAGQGARRQ